MKMHLILALLLLLLLVACAPKEAQTAPSAPQAAAPAPVPATAPAGPKAPAKAAWEIEWERTQAAAREEGAVVLYTTMGAEARQTIATPFRKKYGVSVETVAGAGTAIAARILAEQRAGIYSVDSWISGSTTYRYFPPEGLERLDPLLILPDLTEPDLIKKTWYFGEFPWANKARNMVIGLMSSNEVIVINTNLVKQDELTGYRDFLNPKWKEKISIQDPSGGGMGNMWFAVALEVGDVDINFMRDLKTKQEMFLTRDSRLQVEWLSHGKHAIAIGPETSVVTEFIRLGAPIKRFSLGTPFVSGATSGITIVKKPPHPNAARLFINWLLSQEGQTFHSQAIGVQPQRLDVSTTHLGSSSVLKPGLNVYRSDNEEFAAKRVNIYTPLAKEVFAAR